MGRGLVIALLVLAATAMGALVGPTEASSGREDQMRAQIAQFLNGERTNRGLSPLPIDADLSAQAQAWAEHTRDTGCTTSCHSTWSQGEIIVWGDPTLRTGGLTVAWMKSPNHRNALLYPDSTAIGVGMACNSNGQEVSVVQFRDVYRPVAPTDEAPIATSETWGSPCAGPEGPVPPAPTTTTTTTRPPTTTTTAPPRPRPTTTTAAPRPRPAPPTTVVRVAAPVAPAPPTTTTSTSTTTTSTTTVAPRIALRADGNEITTDAGATEDEATLFAESAATPANAEPAWVAIVVVVVLLSGVKIGSQLRELRAARRLEES